ncbi:MFS transporter [Desulfogranum mediterraneum]|uniref:MFS transporter n=1 Tax=Desulfogranum mediterraneum TaxID=160661 RepID=UPI0003F802CD|nr:MFS transporter [Desulfogranum mediterraneum]
MRKQIFITVFFAVFIALLGVGIMIPVMPIFATELGATGFALGLIVAVFSVSRGLLQPLVGNWSDRWGRKGFLMSGLVIFALVGLLIPQATSVLQLIFIRSFQGVGSAMIVPIGMAYMSYLAPKGEEGRYMSYLNIAIFCGIGCGPIIGGTISDSLGMPAVFYLMAVLSFSALILVMINMPGRIEVEPRGQQGLLVTMAKMVRRKKTMGMLIARCATMIMMVPTMAFLPLLMSQGQQASALKIGLVIACRTLVNALLQIPFGKLADRCNKVLLLVIGTCCMGAVIIAIPHGRTFGQMVLLYMLLGLGEAVIWPVLGAYASEEGRAHYGHGTMMGVYNLAMSAGVFSGALLAGFSMDTWGMEWAFYVSGGAVLCCTGFGAYLIHQEELELTASVA